MVVQVSEFFSDEELHTSGALLVVCTEIVFVINLLD